MLTSMAPAATAGDTVADVIQGEGIEIVDGGDQDMSEPLTSDGIEVETDNLPDEIGDVTLGTALCVRLPHIQ